VVIKEVLFFGVLLYLRVINPSFVINLSYVTDKLFMTQISEVLCKLNYSSYWLGKLCTPNFTKHPLYH